MASNTPPSHAGPKPEQARPPAAAARATPARGLPADLQRRLGNRGVSNALRRPAAGAAEAAQVSREGADSPSAPDAEVLEVEPTSTVGAPGDPLEQEAERLAASSPRTAPPAGVRIHSGGDSARAADEMGAEAFTVGSDIHLGADHPPLTSPAGQELIAHELVHVRQQAGGASPRGRSQAKPRKRKRKDPTGKPFRILVDRPMGPDDLLRTFVAQYYRISNAEELDRVVARWRWKANERAATAADVARTYVQVNVFDFAGAEVDRLDPKDRAAVNAETDRRFFAETGLPTDTRLSGGPQDAQGRARWRGVRANLLAEHAQERALRALPDDISKILFAGGRQIRPAEYGLALDLADRLGRLSQAERARYLATINAGSDDLADLEKSVASFESANRRREWDAERTEEAAAELFGLEELYDLYKAKQAAADAMMWGPALGPMTGAVGMPSATDLDVERRFTADEKFAEALKRSRFKTEAAFVAALAVYQTQFRTEAVNVAMDVLAGYDHILYVAKLKFRDTDAAAKLVTAVGASGAATDYFEAGEADARADMASRRVADDLGKGPQVYPGNPFEYRAQARARRESGSAKVVAASGDEPIIDPAVLGRGTDREKLTHLSGPDARSYLLEVIEERLNDTARARAEFQEDPERIFSLPDLVAATMESQGVDAKTIYGRIVEDHVQEVRNWHLFSSAVLGILALVLAVLVPGGGWLAAAALVTSATISTVQAVQAIDEYRKGSTDYRLSFIRDEPSLVWVGVAVVAAAFDLGMTASQLFKLSAPALKELEAPLKEFAAATDAETAASRLQQLNAQIDAVPGLQQELRSALKARAAAEAGFNQALAGTMKLHSGADPVPLFEALYFGIKKGANTITKLRKESQLMAALGDITKASGATLDELTVAFRRVKRILAIGEKRGMDEATLLKYVDRLAAERAGGEGAFEVLVKDMRSWRPPTAEQIAAEAQLARTHEQLAGLRQTKAEVEAELDAHRAGLRRGGKDRVDELTLELEELTGKPEPGRPRRTPPGEGLIGKASAEFDKAMLLAARAKLDPKVLMRRAFAVSEERAAVLNAANGVDAVGGLRQLPSGIHPDHIVSMQRITEMKGFEKLTLAERRFLAVRPDNLIAMDAAANLSKGERSWAAWRQASHFYPTETLGRMATRESNLYTKIQDWITATVARR